MKNVTIHRSGAPPLTFVGELTAAPIGPDDALQRQHAIELYQTLAGAIVVVVEYTSTRRGETNRTDAQAFRDRAGAAAWLTSYDPCSYVTGWPPLPAYADRQRRLLQQLRERFAALVGEALAALGEREVVP